MRLRGLALTALIKDDVHRWWDGLQRVYPDSETTNSKAYKLLRTACQLAVEREIIPTNPVSIRGASRVESKEKYLPTDDELKAILQHVAPRYRVLTSLCLHHGLRVWVLSSGPLAMLT